MNIKQNGKLILIAIGGNSLVIDDHHRTLDDQYKASYDTCRYIAQLILSGYRIVITHGNGPQVGFNLRRSELALHELHMIPLDCCGSDTQGTTGYQIQKAMDNVMRDWKERPSVATIVTQTLVDGEDPSFKNPTKPIGSFMSKADAEMHRDKDGWSIIEDSGRGYRRVVASPLPLEILELDAIQCLLNAGVVVVCLGGGGIPVFRDTDGTLTGAEAVIDKDLASSLLAQKLKADIFAITTAVDNVCLNFNKPDQKTLKQITMEDARQYLNEGHFARGSMGPKIEAILSFLESGAREAFITSPPNLLETLQGNAGTKIYRN